MYRPKIQKAQLLAGTLTKKFELSFGEGLPENVFIGYDTNTLSGSETLDFTGKFPGNDNYQDEVLITQVSLASDDVKLADLSSVGPLTTVLVTAGGIASTETIDLVCISW
jgi:hypothetical protein